MNAILKRFSEPSTWAAVAALLAVAGINLPPDWASGLAGGIAAVAAIVTGVMGVFMKEKGPEE